MTDQLSNVTRRELLAGAAGALGGAVLAGLTADPALAANVDAQLPTPTAPSAMPADPAAAPGAPTSAVGERSPFAPAPPRAPVGDVVGTSLTPLQSLTGTITPSDLHFERHHAGVPAIDPARHELVVHGLVDRPLVFSVEELKRFPSVTRIYFVECSGNGRTAWRTPKPEMTAQQIDGMTSNAEWTGVPVATLFREAGARPEATWFLAEGGDSCKLSRSIPIEKAREDALVVWAQNGEALRPEQGFPLRLLLPGWEGNANVKWLRRLELGREPWMTRWETAKYTDPLPNESARQFSFTMDAKSIITSLSYPAVLPGPGWYPLAGIAWSGRGRITSVEISVDGGATWSAAELQQPVLSKAHTRFSRMWRWEGGEAVVLSRAVDETGYVQPTRTALLAARGIGTDYHFNCLRGWRIAADGRVFFHGET